MFEFEYRRHPAFKRRRQYDRNRPVEELFDDLRVFRSAPICLACTCVQNEHQMLFT